MAEVFLEIGMEEIPARFLRPALDQIAEKLVAEFAAQRLTHGAVTVLGTPRRLVAGVAGLADRQPDEEVTRTGPPWDRAFDADGKPTKAAEGFARGQGVDPSALVRIETEKGAYVGVRKVLEGRATETVLAELLAALIASLTFPKSMRWGAGEMRFARPLHRIVALLDGKRIPFSVGGIETTDESVGHRFLSPAPFTVKGLDDYLKQTRDAGLEIDPAKRRERIARDLARLAESVGGSVVEDEALLDEVTCLTESPWPILGSFEDKYLALPREVIVTPMRAHQKYFPVQDAKGKLLPHFIAVSDIRPRDDSVVAAGYAKVLRARLEDARFFFEEDRKVRLAKRADDLKGMIFQKKLGSYADKTKRVEMIARFLAPQVEADVETAAAAAELCKADLLTHMVGEFPELQGIMGGHYARLEGLGDAVADAIREHYLPLRQGGELPASAAGAVVAVADKIDTICGMFAIGQIPKGSGDPYALRRAALGIVAILQQREWKFSLAALFEKARDSIYLERSGAAGFDTGSKEYGALAGQLAEFFRGRLYNLYTGQGYSHEVVEAVLSAGFDDLTDLDGRLKAIAELRERPDFEPLALSFKRVANILDAAGPGDAVDPALFEYDEERALFESFGGVRESVAAHLAERRYAGALADLATLKAPVDAFFDKVLVNCEDVRLRTNRQALLGRIARTFTGIADFKQFAV